MTAVCREPCCAAPRMTVSELVERGMRRRRSAPLPIEGELFTDVDGHGARFSLTFDGGRIGSVGFGASSCATLIAYCEWIAETTPGRSAELAAGISARDLVDALPGVPPLKRSRAIIAVAAFRSVLAVLTTRGNGS